MSGPPQEGFCQPRMLYGLQPKCILRLPENQQTTRGENRRQHHDRSILAIRIGWKRDCLLTGLIGITDHIPGLDPNDT